MSQEALVRFYKAMFTDDNIRKQTQEALAANDGEKLVEIGNANGFEFSLEELNAFTKVVRAWRDPEFRNSLSDEERSQLPENPLGDEELDEEFLKQAVGGKPKPGGGWVSTVSGDCCKKTGTYIHDCNPF
ncbi:MAG: mersacidin/lichenicidin family type 2 lantibiotic [Candidatus Hydrogenedentota bacterium]|nr:MAG: mersacidin/lichenicidin family type 2 lantibiotic [Candidatus Hydrogenedentota bacterium]